MQGIVIQGPTNYFEKIIPAYIGVKNVVWSTWDDEPIENIEYIKSHMNVVLSKKPEHAGVLNVNYQTTSTTAGLYYLKNKGVTEVLKTRGDILPNDINLFLDLLKGKSMSFLAIAKEGVRKDIQYNLVYPHYSHDYPMDLIVYGNIDNMINAFGFLTLDYEFIPPESLIAYNFLNGIGAEFKLNYEHFIKNNVHFYLNDCLKNSIKLQWVKNDVEVIELHNNRYYYDF